MYDRILVRMRTCIRSNNYRMSEHAKAESWDEGITLIAIEQAVLEGSIVERQRDSVSNEHKFVVRSSEHFAGRIEIVAKFGPVGELYIITGYSI